MLMLLVVFFRCYVGTVFDYVVLQQVILQPVDSLKDVHNCLQVHLNRYNEEFGNVYLDINLSENVIAHIVKLHRVLSYHHG